MEIYEGRLRFREDDGTISEVVSPSGPHGPLQRYIDDGTILTYYPVYRRFATESEITRPAGGSYAPSTGLTPPTGWALDAGDLTGEGITVTSLVFVKQDNTLLYADPIRDNIGVDAFINGRLWDTTIVSPINIANLNNVLVYSAVEAASGESGVPLCDVQYIRTDTNAPLTTVAGERSFSSNEHGKLFLTDISSRIAAIRALNSDYAGEINVCITNFKPQNVKGTVSTQDMDYTGINFDTVLARVPAGTNAAQWIYRAPNGKPMIQFHDQRTFNASDISGEQLLVAADLILPDDGNSSRFLSGDSNLYPSINFRDDGRFIFINTSNNDYSNTTVNPRGYQLFGYARYSSGQDYAMDVWIGDQLAVEAVPVGHSWSGGVTFEMRDMFLGTIVMARSIADVPGTAFDNYIGNSWVNLLQHRLLVDPPAYITGSAEASTDLSDMPQSLDAADRGKALVLNATNTAYVLEIILQGTIGDTLTRSSAGVYDVANPFTTSDESELDRLARKTGDHHSDAVRLVTRVPYDAIWDDPSVSGITRVSSELFWADNLEIITQNGLLNATDSISGYGGSGEPTVYAWARNSGNYYVGGDDDRIRFYDVTRRTMFGSAQSIPGEIVAMSIDEADETELFVLYKIDDATMHARNYTVSTTEGNTTFTMGADHALSLADVNAALVANDRRVLFSFNHGEPTDADGLTGAARRGSHLYILINGTIFTRTSGILGAVSILRIAVSGSGTGVTYGAVDPNYFVNIGDFPNVNDLAVFGPASNPEGYWISERYTINEFLTDRLESTDIFGFPDVLLAADRGKALVLNSTNTGYTLEDVLQGTIGNTLSRSAAGVFDVTNPFTQADEDELDRLARQADDSHDDDVKLRHRLSLGDLLTNGYNLGIDYIASAVFWSDDLTIIANNGILSDTETISGYGGSGEPDVVAMARNSGNYYVAGDDDRIRFYDVATQTMFGSAQTMPGDILAMSIDESNETELLVLYKTSDTAVMVRNFTVSATASDDTFTTGTDNSLDKPQIDAVLTANGRRVLNSLHHGDITNQSGVTGLSRRQGYIYLLINGQIFTRTSGILDAISILRMTVSGSGSGLTLGAIDSNFFHGIGDYSNANDLVVYGPGNDPEGYWVTEIGHVDDFERNVIHITDIDGMPDTLVPAERGFSLIQNSTDTGFTLRDDRVATAVYRGRGQTDNLETAVSITPQHGDLAVLRFNEDPDSHRYGGDTIIESLDTPYPQYVIDNMASYAAHRLQSHQVFQALQDGIYDVTINVAGQQFNINQYLEWKLITLGATSDGTIDYTTAGTPLDLSLLNIYSTRMTLVAKEVNLSVGDYFYFMWNTGQGTAFNALYYIVFERKGS